jgi:lipid-A-disaccharide synthase
VAAAPLQLGLVAGEASGDILGGAVLGALAQRHELALSGIGGARMGEYGLDSLYPMDRLSVFGLAEPLMRLPELLRIRRDVIAQQLQNRPDVFLGIDAPDFNLGVERTLRAEGIATAHLVSPSVWAWRAGRIHKIRRAVDLMLCLLPFELAVYQQAGVPAVCVGHPLIEELEQLSDQATLRTRLAIPAPRRVVAVLPGSRGGEVAHLMPVFAETMRILAARHSDLAFVVPAADHARHAAITEHLKSHELPVQVVEGNGREVMKAADCVLLASGTATLEAMLLRKPMVIAYRMAWLSWQILSRVVTTEFVGLPNILAGRSVVPELLQDAATPAALADAVDALFAGGDNQQVATFDELAAQIGSGFAERCADAIDGLTVRR